MSSEENMYGSSCPPLLLQPDSGVHTLNFDPLLLLESSLCLTSIAQGFSTWVSYADQVTSPIP
jgi:hypothetical protein